MKWCMQRPESKARAMNGCVSSFSINLHVQESVALEVAKESVFSEMLHEVFVDVRGEVLWANKFRGCDLN